MRQVVGDLIWNRPVRNKSLNDLRRDLTRTRDEINTTIARVSDSEQNRRVVSHIVGIERWGQSRLRVMLGEPLTLDEYNDYRPVRDADWTTLTAAFADTRATTLTLIESIAAANHAAHLQVHHNQYGGLTLRGWLRYLSLHASIESRRLR